MTRTTIDLQDAIAIVRVMTSDKLEAVADALGVHADRFEVLCECVRSLPARNTLMDVVLQDADRVTTPRHCVMARVPDTCPELRRPVSRARAIA